ncbi:hypothetical protein [Haloplanus aerogenes]|uniref:Uncharacterized protein n=1 Tax=Haloplanus aerogenes TaxID=660522 RepID=A0A3M0CHN4_9EURY|nr:hypothetical protein [Haloplanus aerogenes]AZH26798.1 hypothetical protein DU502_16085 [Haloplanus aerogenes]RMB09111.1 hypothetical protein ATH50_3482 [Haloplanus aerogenes]
MSTYKTTEERIDSERIENIAAYMAGQLGRGFVYHDQRRREAAVKAFAAVDALQFAHLDEDAATEAAEAYVDALWAKDEVEDACRVDGDGRIDADGVAEADWSAVEEGFERRAEVAGIDSAYASLTTEAWINHKAGGDYWTPMMKAQMFELRAAMQDPEYPDKPRSGQSGFGPEPARYALGIELHDTRKFDEGREAMTPYFERVLDAHDDSYLASISVPNSLD